MNEGNVVDAESKAMEVPRVLHMNEGCGETSYAKNSLVQKKVQSTTRPIIEEAIRDFYCSSFPDSLGIADLGCSSGPNTLLLVSDIISGVEGMCHNLHRPIPEFRVFLNDLPGNDFNTLFKSLPAFYEKLKKDNNGRETCSACFIAGVPGSFYGRVFPKRSIDFVHSSSSLQWLSQVPPELDVEAKTPLNKGRVYISRTSPTSVINAYLAQFRSDFSLFLKSRSEEIVAGGRMVLTLLGRTDADPANDESCHKFDIVAHALNDMVLKGLIKKEMVDSFNFPFYEPSPEELKLEIEKEGSFVLHHQAVCPIDWDDMDNDNKEMGTTTTAAIKGEQVAKNVRAVAESMLKNHFGEEMMDDLFLRMGDILQHTPRVKAKFNFIVISLIRKG